MLRKTGNRSPFNGAKSGRYHYDLEDERSRLPISDNLSIVRGFLTLWDIVMNQTAKLKQLLDQRILVLDGAMGSLIQAYMLDEAGFRGQRFADFAYDVRGNNDLLSLTQPDIVRAIYSAYLEAGADIITTNTFNANAISQADYHLSDVAYEMNVAAAQLAREAADVVSAREPHKPRFVAGSLGPLNRTLSLSPDVNDPGLSQCELG